MAVLPTNDKTGDTKVTPLNDALAALRKEKADLERLIARVNTAIDALTDEPATRKKAPAKKTTKKAATKKRKPMSAAAKKAVSDRMKQYWAGRKK